MKQGIESQENCPQSAQQALLRGKLPSSKGESRRKGQEHCGNPQRSVSTAAGASFGAAGPAPPFSLPVPTSSQRYWASSAVSGSKERSKNLSAGPWNSRPLSPVQVFPLLHLSLLDSFALQARCKMQPLVSGSPFLEVWWNNDLPTLPQEVLGPEGHLSMQLKSLDNTLAWCCNQQTMFTTNSQMATGH